MCNPNEGCDTDETPRLGIYLSGERNFLLTGAGHHKERRLMRPPDTGLNWLGCRD